MMSSFNKEDKIRFVLDELINKGNFEIINMAFSSDYVAHAGEKLYRGHEFLHKFSNQLRKAIPDIKVVDINFLLEDEDKIVWQRTLSGVNKSNMQGIPASDKKVTWVEMVVTRFRNEKIIEEWIVSELMGELLLKVPKSRNK